MKKGSYRLILVNYFGVCKACLNFWFDESSKKLGAKIENFNATDDWESSEKSHGASNQAQLAFETDLLVSFDLVVGGRVKEDVDKLKRWTG